MIHRNAIAALSLLLSLSARAQEPREQYAVLVDTFTEPILVGMKLSFAKNYRQGKLSLVQYQCTHKLQSSVLRESVYELLVRSLSEDELADAQRFFASDTGRKYAKYGVLQIYSAVGEKKSEPEPSFTSQDESIVMAFSNRSAGRKLIREQILERSGLREAVAPHINGFVRECMAVK